jgi:hypothetical protein
MRHAELRLAKWIQLVLVRPAGGKKDARPEENTLKMALRRNTPYLCESKIGK